MAGNTEDNPILISSASDLNSIRNTQDEYRFYKQVAHIDLRGYSDWKPINLNGEYDGNGFTISNLTIKSFALVGEWTNAVHVGLFGNPTYNSYMRNINIMNAHLEFKIAEDPSFSRFPIAYYHVGILCGLHPVGIADCHVQGVIKVTSTNNSRFVHVGIGGLSGNNSRGSMFRCSSDVSIDVSGSVYQDSSSLCVGGFIPASDSNANTLNMANCCAVGKININFSSYWASRDITIKINDFCGSQTSSFNSPTIENCYAVIERTVNIPLLNFRYGPKVYLYETTFGHSQGGVKSSYYRQHSKPNRLTVMDYSTGTKSETPINLGTPKTDAELKTISTFAGWDFETIWKINEGVSYPYHVLRKLVKKTESEGVLTAIALADLTIVGRLMILLKKVIKAFVRNVIRNSANQIKEVV